MNSKGEADYVTSSIGLIAFLMWHDIYPDDLTFEPFKGCVYHNRDVNWGELINSYWLGEKIPVCEMSECIVVAKRILDKGKIDKDWYLDMHEAIDDIQEDYIFPVM